MKERYLSPLLQGACFMLLSLLLQNCDRSHNLPVEGGEEPPATTPIEQGRRKRARIETEEYQQERSMIPAIMPELWQIIFSHLDFEGVLAAREVSTSWNELITGFRQPGIVGVENKSLYIINTSNWTKNKEIDFQDSKLKKLTPQTIPSFLFYQLMQSVKNLPPAFWPYLKESQVHILNLDYNYIRVKEAITLGRYLQGTNIHTLILSDNQLKVTGTIALVKQLQETNVHTLDLSCNQISDTGAIGLAQHLQKTSIHALYLRNNQIGNAGAIALAKHLQGTDVRVLDLSGNQISDTGAIELARCLQETNVDTLDLEWNQISTEGVIELAHHLPSFTRD
jgi:hypothetical protein